MIEEAERGGIKALYIMGENVLRSIPQAKRVRAALNNLQLVVVQDIMPTETSEVAHVVLPGAAFSEKEGSFTNVEGRIQTFNPVVSPPGEAKPDWKILDELAFKLGAVKQFGSVKNIRSEISLHVSPYASLGKGEGETWVAENTIKAVVGPGGDGKKVCFASVRASAAPAATPSSTYDKTAIISSVRFHLGSGTRTSCSQRLFDYELTGGVHLSSDDAASLEMRSGDIVRVVSAHGMIERAICVDKNLKPGFIFVPAAFNGNDARNLLALAAFENGKPPGWNACPVRIERC
jgi:predicted molibdopterin-dependent oxidoreductase YjgC